MTIRCNRSREGLDRQFVRNKSWAEPKGDQNQGGRHDRPRSFLSFFPLFTLPSPNPYCFFCCSPRPRSTSAEHEKIATLKLIDPLSLAVSNLPTNCSQFTKTPKFAFLFFFWLLFLVRCVQVQLSGCSTDHSLRTIYELANSVQ